MPEPKSGKPARRKSEVPRQKSAWDLFLADFRQSKEASGLKPTDVMVKAGAKYKTLSPAQKEKLLKA